MNQIEFSCERDVLLDGMKDVMRVVGDRTTLPVLQNVLLTSFQQKLHLAGYNLRSAIVTPLPVEAQGLGVLVKARDLKDALANMPKGHLSIVAEDMQAIKILNGSSTRQLRADDPKDYPTLPDVCGGFEAVIECQVLKEALDRVLPFAYPDDDRQYLQTVHWVFLKDKLTLETTDTFRLAVLENIRAYFFAPERRTYLLRSHDLHQLVSLIGKRKGNIRITFAENLCRFEFEDGTTFVTSRVEGHFPGSSQITDETWDCTITFDTQELGVRLLSLKPIAKENAYRGVFDFQAGKVTIQATDKMRAKATESMPIEFDGEPIRIGLDIQYLVQALVELKSTKGKLHLRGVTNPVLLTPADGDDFKYVLMPIILREEEREGENAK